MRGARPHSRQSMDDGAALSKSIGNSVIRVKFTHDRNQTVECLILCFIVVDRIFSNLRYDLGPVEDHSVVASTKSNLTTNNSFA